MMMTGNNKNSGNPLRKIRCAIYTRKSSDEGLEQEFNSLDAQREAALAYIESQRHEGWMALSDKYDDGGYSGGSLERPALQRLLSDVEKGMVDCIVVYKIDRLTRSLLDFSKMVEIFDQHRVTFISITQQFNTTTSMGRLTLNMLLSFAQFEREIIGERIRDKVAAAKKRGKYMGGTPVLGYDVDREKKKLVVNEEEVKLVIHIFQRFIKLGSSTQLVKEFNREGFRTKSWTTKRGAQRGGVPFNKSHIYRLLNNPIYLGKVVHKGKTYPGEHKAIVPNDLWDKAHAILEENHRVRANQTRTATPALLKGVIRCGCCGCAMGPTFTRKNGRTYRYYLCVQASKNGYDSCEVKSVAAGTIEEMVLKQLKAIFQSPEVIAKTYSKVKIEEEVYFDRLGRERIELEANLQNYRGKADKLLKMLDGNGVSNTFSNELQDYDEEMAKIEERLSIINQEIAVLQNQHISQADVTEALEKLDPLWEQLFPAEQARIAELLLERVTVYPDEIDIQLHALGIRTLVSELQGIER